MSKNCAQCAQCDVCMSCARLQVIEFAVNYLVDRVRPPPAINTTTLAELHMTHGFVYSPRAYLWSAPTINNVFEQCRGMRSKLTEDVLAQLTEKSIQKCGAQNALYTVIDRDSDGTLQINVDSDVDAYTTKSALLEQMRCAQQQYALYTGVIKRSRGRHGRSDLALLSNKSSFFSRSYIEYVNSLLCLSKPRAPPVASSKRVDRIEFTYHLSDKLLCGLMANDESVRAEHVRTSSFVIFDADEAKYVMRSRMRERLSKALYEQHTRGELTAAELAAKNARIFDGIDETDTQYAGSHYFFRPPGGASARSLERCVLLLNTFLSRAILVQATLVTLVNSVAFNELINRVLRRPSIARRKLPANSADTARVSLECIEMLVDQMTSDVESLYATKFSSRPTILRAWREVNRLVNQTKSSSSESDNEESEGCGILDDIKRTVNLRSMSEWDAYETCTDETDTKPTVPALFAERIRKSSCTRRHNEYTEYRAYTLVRRLCLLSDVAYTRIIEYATAAHQLLCSLQPYASLNGATARFVANCALMSANLPQLGFPRHCPLDVADSLVVRYNEITAVALRHYDSGFFGDYLRRLTCSDTASAPRVQLPNLSAYVDSLQQDGACTHTMSNVIESVFDLCALLPSTQPDEDTTWGLCDTLRDSPSLRTVDILCRFEREYIMAASEADRVKVDTEAEKIAAAILSDTLDNHCTF